MAAAAAAAAEQSETFLSSAALARSPNASSAWKQYARHTTEWHPAETLPLPLQHKPRTARHHDLCASCRMGAAPQCAPGRALAAIPADTGGASTRAATRRIPTAVRGNHRDRQTRPKVGAQNHTETTSAG